ncbi:MAG: NAD(P)/FAD-dependent oxidoreductase [Verrucomicrobia bacterium]|nr:NAD(P)/FAD-dependent oxidoreductase [Verrucomicrobiota bacterium]
MANFDFDTVVVGGGSAGYAAARTLAEGGQRLAVIEGGREVGGLCILRGCMPTKALLHAAELRRGIREAETWGITTGEVRIDLPRMFAHKDALIGEFATYRRQQLERGRWEFIRARARWVDAHTVELDSGRRITAANFVIATGSELAPPPVPGLAEVGYLCSDTAMTLTRLPESLVVLGGGAVSLEFAQFFARLGTQVTLVQRGPHVLREADTDVARELESALRDEGIRVFTSTRIVGVDRTAEGKRLRFLYDGNELEVTAQEIFHGLGRRPAVGDLNLPAAGVALTSTSRIQVNAHQQTSVPHVWAAGDCCGPHDIVHLAILRGEVAAKNILGQSAEMDDRLLLSVVFTDPAVAMVGLTETMARAQGREFRVATYPFNDHGKSIIMGSQRGFVKLLAAKDTGEILGGACVGPHGGELIQEIVVAMDRRMTAAQLAAVPHYHPTLAEIWTYPAEELRVES